MSPTCTRCPYFSAPVFVSHEGWTLSQGGAHMLFGLVVCLGKKPCPKGVRVAEKTWRPFGGLHLEDHSFTRGDEGPVAGWAGAS